MDKIMDKFDKKVEKLISILDPEFSDDLELLETIEKYKKGVFCTGDVIAVARENSNYIVRDIARDLDALEALWYNQ